MGILRRRSNLMYDCHRQLLLLEDSLRSATLLRMTLYFRQSIVGEGFHALPPENVRIFRICEANNRLLPDGNVIFTENHREGTEALPYLILTSVIASRRKAPSDEGAVSRTG